MFPINIRYNNEVIRNKHLEVNEVNSMIWNRKGNRAVVLYHKGAKISNKICQSGEWSTIFPVTDYHSSPQKVNHHQCLQD